MTDDIDVTPEAVERLASDLSTHVGWESDWQSAATLYAARSLRALSTRLAEVEAERNQYAEGYAQTLGRKWNADDAMIRAALEAVHVICEDYYRALSSIKDFDEMQAINKQMEFIEAKIRAMRDDPEALAAIKAKAAEGRT